ncbi:hypothetical protein [Chitinophaga vietnamensis]|uniref:hypothetical protein n=1 Tax=Chitinophaga vietnamensis TaxID=2593957 RepID=UPI0011777E7A|nr:hypothetical protein [Chitinophaga vietnamensis]
MGPDVLTYNNEGIKNGAFEIDEDLHYWLFNKANLDTEEYTTLFEIKDYYKTNAQLAGERLQSFIHALEQIKISSPFSKEIDFIINKINQNNIKKIRITGD